MEGSSHLLALKVMRVSRPSLVGQWQPYSSSSSHTATLPTSMQHHTYPESTFKPRTAADFTALSPFLSLPSNFGTISLGETFTSILCITNSTNATIEGVSLHVELHSSSTKAVLLDTVPISLSPSVPTVSPLTTAPTNSNNKSSLEALISAEIKDLGQHTLTAIVSYIVPAHIRIPTTSDDPTDPRKMVFRKHYRFPVTNPFNVKTKVHVPKSLGMQLDRAERDKIWLEVHVQNLTGEGMCFDKLEFVPVEGWLVQDGNLSGGMKGIIRPQDIYQYVYVLTPSITPSFPIKHAPGSVIPLGRLDMAWRSTLGEPGRLLTSMLSRRIPPAPAPAQQAAPIPALPPHVTRVISAMPRPRSPSPSISSITSPSTTTTAIPSSASSNASNSRPSSPVPYKSRVPNPNISRPHTPVQSHHPSNLPYPLAPHQFMTGGGNDVQLDLVIDQIQAGEAGEITINDSFNITFTLTICTSTIPEPRKKRMLWLGIQHLIHSKRPSSHTNLSRKTGTTVANTGTGTERRTTITDKRTSASASGISAAMSTPRIQSLDLTPVVESPLKHRSLSNSHHHHITLPSPYVDDAQHTHHSTIHANQATTNPNQATLSGAGLALGDGITRIGTGEVEFNGASFVKLEPFVVLQKELASTQAAGAGTTPLSTHTPEFTPTPTSVLPSAMEKRAPNPMTPIGTTEEGKRILTRQFTLEYLPVRAGLANVNGLRVLWLGEREVDDDWEGEKNEGDYLEKEAKVLAEWPVVAEVWIDGA